MKRLRITDPAPDAPAPPMAPVADSAQGTQTGGLAQGEQDWAGQARQPAATRGNGTAPPHYEKDRSEGGFDLPCGPRDPRKPAKSNRPTTSSTTPGDVGVEEELPMPLHQWLQDLPDPDDVTEEDLQAMPLFRLFLMGVKHGGEAYYPRVASRLANPICEDADKLFQDAWKRHASEKGNKKAAENELEKREVEAIAVTKAYESLYKFLAARQNDLSKALQKSSAEAFHLRIQKKGTKGECGEDRFERVDLTTGPFEDCCHRFEVEIGKYFRRQVRGAIIKYYKTKHAKKPPSDDTVALSQPGVGGYGGYDLTEVISDRLAQRAFDQLAAKLDVESILEDLNVTHKRLLSMYYLEKKPYRQIAKALGMGLGSVHEEKLRAIHMARNLAGIETRTFHEFKSDLKKQALEEERKKHRDTQDPSAQSDQEDSMEQE